MQSIFGLNADLDGDGKPDTQLAALNYKGGSGITGAQRNLLRAAVAALLNAANDTVDYPLSEAEVIAQVSAALTGDRNTMLSLAGQLDKYNNLGCPLGRADAAGISRETHQLFMPVINN